jgi:hypothetical protein
MPCFTLKTTKEYDDDDNQNNDDDVVDDDDDDDDDDLHQTKMFVFEHLSLRYLVKKLFVLS